MTWFGVSTPPPLFSTAGRRTNKSYTKIRIHSDFMTVWNRPNMHPERVLLILLPFSRYFFSPTVYVIFLLSDLVQTLYISSTYHYLRSFVSSYFPKNLDFYMLLVIFDTFLISDLVETLCTHIKNLSSIVIFFLLVFFLF